MTDPAESAPVIAPVVIDAPDDPAPGPGRAARVVYLSLWTLATAWATAPVTGFLAIKMAVGVHPSGRAATGWSFFLAMAGILGFIGWSAGLKTLGSSKAHRRLMIWGGAACLLFGLSAAGWWTASLAAQQRPGVFAGVGEALLAIASVPPSSAGLLLAAAGAWGRWVLKPERSEFLDECGW